MVSTLKAVIVVNVVSTCRGAQVLQFCLAMMAWTPMQHPVHCTRGRTRMTSVIWASQEHCYRRQLYISLLRVSPWLRNTYWVRFLQQRDWHCYCTSSSASASNCIHALRKNHAYAWRFTMSFLQNVINCKYTWLHTLVSYVLLLGRCPLTQCGVMLSLVDACGWHHVMVYAVTSWHHSAPLPNYYTLIIRTILSTILWHVTQRHSA